jgi:DNA-binding CsgD family transcriptional regulator
VLQSAAVVSHPESAPTWSASTKCALVGRRREIDELARLARPGCLVAVVGEAGVGKTSLVSTVLADRPHRVGGALAMLAARPYLALERAIGGELVGTPDDVAADVLDACADRTLFVDDVQWAHPLTIEAIDLLRRELAIVVTSRPANGGGTLAVEPDHVIMLTPLSSSSARTLARRLHPDLPDDDRERLIAIAAGNPLLLTTLIEGRVVSPTMLAAVERRLAVLDPAIRDALGKLALLARPGHLAELDGAKDLDSLVRAGGEGWVFRHPLIGESIALVLDDSSRRRLHRELADELKSCDPAEAAHHLMLAGAWSEARDRARAATDVADVAVRASLLELIADATAALDECADAAWVDAAEALVDAGRLADALGAADRVVPPSAHHAAARLQAGRARWFRADVIGAAAELDEALTSASADEPDLRIRIQVERAYLAVRTREPGSIEVAREVFDAASGTEHRARAGACLGAAMLYDGVPGWDDLLASVAEQARADGDLEVAFAAAFHLASGLGFVGRFQDAVDLDGVQVELAEAAGLHTWAAQFLAARLFTRAQMAQATDWIVDESHRFLRSRPLSRNRFQVEHSLVFALCDLGRLDEATERLRVFEASAMAAEEHTLAATTAADLAWIARDGDAMERALVTTRGLGDAWFGVRLVAEAAAAMLAFERSEPFEPLLPTVTLPVLWTALHEIDGARRAVEGDLAGALGEFDTAASRWDGTHPRYRVRALEAGAIVARRMGRRDAVDRHREAVEVARRHGLIAHLTRLGAALDPRVTGREDSILRMVASGDTTSRIAAKLGLKPATVDAHIESAVLKLGAINRREAADMVTRLVGAS